MQYKYIDGVDKQEKIVQENETSSLLVRRKISRNSTGSKELETNNEGVCAAYPRYNVSLPS